MNKYPFYQNEPVDSIVQIIERSEKMYRDSVAIRFKKNKAFHDKSYLDLATDSRNLAGFLLDQSYNKGHIAVFGSPSYEWIITYFGTAFAGMVIVPLDVDLPADELYDLIVSADVECVFYDEQYADIVDMLKNYHLPKIQFLSLNIINSLSFKEISLPTVDPDRLSAILFTSGTTNKSKGVMLTQRNIASNVIQGLGAVDLQHGKDVLLSVLPLNHAYAFTGILMFLYRGAMVCISSGLKYIQKDIIDLQPTLMYVVPLIAEKLYEKVLLSVKKQNKEKAFSLALKICSFFKKINIDLTEKYFAEIKSAFGGKLKRILCGGAPLNEGLIGKFGGIGINLIQGYGLTECSPLLTANFDYYHRSNSVGKVVEGNCVKIVDGEIWAKGTSVSQGYYNDPESNAESFEGGWFKTGDLGSVDKDNFLYITGRKKNLIILNNGKNVSAEELENRLYQIPCVNEVIVYGESDKIIAEIYSEDNQQDSLLEVLNTEIDKINRTLPAYKNIDKIILREAPFPKTTTKKIKRYK